MFELENCKNEIIDIVNYITDFCNLDSTVIEHFIKSFIKIKISNDKLYECFEGKYNDEEIIKIIENNMPEDSSAAHCCKGLKGELLNPSEKQNKGAIKELLDSLKRMVENEDFESKEPLDVRKIRKILDVFKNRNVSMLVLGVYNHRKREIVLYRQSIIDTATQGDPYKNMKRVLSHETFHAVHHYLIDGAKQKNSKFDKYRKENCARIVIEGLARFVEYNYCQDKLYGLYCNELKTDWDEYFFEVFPYSSAKYLEESTKSKEEKSALIQRLIFGNKNDFIDAYHDIVYLYKKIENFDNTLDRDVRNIKRYKNQPIVPSPFDCKINDIRNRIKNYNRKTPNTANDAEKLYFLTVNKEKEVSANRTELFEDTLTELLNNRNIEENDLKKIANIKKEEFNNLRNGLTPKRNVVCLLAIALKLNSQEYENFIKAAGFERNTDDEDPINIVGVYIDNGEYDLYEIELTIRNMAHELLDVFNSDRYPNERIDLDE